MTLTNAFARALAFATALTAPVAAQTTDDDSDSTRTYRLGEIVVRADTMRRVEPATVQAIPFVRLARTDAPTAAGLLYQVPAARVQTNSRGEALVYIRASAERQVALFFDGALLNVPWDNRLDMSLLPTGAIGGITVGKGAPSVLYGANTIGGTINIVSIDRAEQGSSTQINTQAGSSGLIGGSLLHSGRAGSISYIAEAGYTAREGFALPGRAALAFNQAEDALRTNSDLRSLNLYLRAENEFSESSEAGIALFVTDAEKGVAPEGHVEDARFWRYPTWRAATLSLNSETIFGDERQWFLRGAAWGTQFAQDIAQYADARYATLTAREEDRDLTFGARLILGRSLGDARVTLALNALSSVHDQRDLRYDSAGALVALTDSAGNVLPWPTSTYEQRVYSAGIEAERRMGDVSLTLGASIDGMATPKTGDKPAQAPFNDYSVVGGASYELTDGTAVCVSGGRKTRFPTMRELYGEALRRFLVNPGLKPEETWVGEVGVESRGETGAVAVVGFLYDTKNAIDQRSLDTLGARKRQRINLPGSRAIGVELTGSLRTLAPLRIDGHFTYVSARGRARGSDGTDSSFFLTEKPEIVSTMTAEYLFDVGLQPSLELVHTGRAYSPNDDNELVPLDPSTVVNLRLAYRFAPWDESLLQLYVRVNNATDALVQPQLGLPAAGREIVAGLKLTL